LTLYIVIGKCGYKLPEMIIILILTAIHTISSSSELIFYILKLIFGHSYLNSGSIQCIVYSITVASTLKCELFTVGLLAFMRHAIVCHNIIKSTKLWLICYFIIISPLVAIYLYPIITLDGNLQPSHLYCSPYLKPSPNVIFLSFINALIFVIPCWVSTYCCFLIGIKVYKKLKLMENEATASNENDQIIRIQS
jgi:hypothetical protein